MSKKKEIKQLQQEIAELKAEITEMKETAQKNATMLVEKIEQLAVPSEKPKMKRETKKVAPASVPAKASKKKTGTKKIADEEGATVSPGKDEPPVVFEKPAEEEAKTEKKTRTRKPRAAVKTSKEAEPTSTPKEKKSRAPRTKFSFILYNCDELKSSESLFNRNDETFTDTALRRKALWNKLKTEVSEGRIKILDNVPMDNIRLEILSGAPESVNKHLQYGLIEKIENK